MIEEEPTARFDPRDLIGPVVGPREEVAAERLAELAAQRWKIDLDNEMRSGFLGVPGRPVRWQTSFRAGAELRFAYGVHGSCSGGAFRFEVAALRGKDRSALFSRELPCTRKGWQQARVPLRGLAEGPLTLELTTAADGPFDPVAGMPAWAGVELVGGRPAGLNVILISVDTLRPDHLSLYGYDRRTSPRLDARAERGAVVFERAVAAAPWTLPSHASMFTGLDADRHSVNWDLGLPPSLRTLAEILHHAGYATHAVTAGGFVHQRYGFDQGFDVYSSFSDRMGFARELESGVERARNVLEQLQDRRFFLFFHTYAVHNPFRPRQPYLRRLTGRTSSTLVDSRSQERRPELGFQTRRVLFEMIPGGEALDTPASAVHDLAVDLYDSGVAYADAHLGRLWHAIDDLGLDRRTLIVFTSDHGELFGEHGQVNHYSLYDANVLVPLVVLDPEFEPGVRRVGGQVRSIDLLPTILDRLGLPVPDGIDGRSFAPLLRRTGGEASTGDAWSYAPSSNFGISLRRADGTAFIARNDAWVSPGPREELFRDHRPLTGTGADALRDAVEDRLRTRLPGLRIRLRNPGAEPIQARLWGPCMTRQRLKLEQIGPGVATQQGVGRVAVTLAPGDDLTLVAESPAPAPAHVVLEHPRWGRGRVDFDPGQVEGTLWGGWTGSAWRMGEGEPADGFAVAVWFPRSDPAVAVEGEEPDDEGLRRQLRALGYLN